jgi:hypothetical protein
VDIVMTWLVLQEGTGHDVGAVVEIDDELQWRHWRRRGLIVEAPPDTKAPRRRRTTKDDG